MSNVENKQSTVENNSPQEKQTQLKRIVEEKRTKRSVYADLNKIEVGQATTETIQKTDQLKNEIDKSKYENLPLQTYNEIVK